MHLNLIIDSKQAQVEVPQAVLEQGHDFFAKIDKDMDHGWKMGPEFVANPDTKQRIQIVADRILVALESNKRELLHLLAGYVMTRDPKISGLRINTSGEPLETEILYK